jgi:hypothetical protein
MNNNSSPQDAWLNFFNPETDDHLDYWDPGFESERRVVFSKLGPFSKVFICPEHFSPRFYHRIYPLPIAEWQLIFTTRLYSGFCTITATLDINFQATFSYIKANMDIFTRLNEEISENIKKNYQGLIKDIVLGELSLLKDGGWVQTGLQTQERRIENMINESLLIKNIQCRTICALEPVFEEITEDQQLDSRFTQSPIYFNLLQKNFEFREQQKMELFKQEQLLEIQRLANEQKQLEYIAEQDEIQRQKLELEALAERRKLESEENIRLEQQALEMRLCLSKMIHEKTIKELEFDSELKIKKEQLQRQQQFEQEMRLKQLEHERSLKEKELNAEIEEMERVQIERQKIMEKLEIGKISHQNRIHQMQLEAELKELELRAEASKNKDIYLRREIEWLVLDKQRVEMARSIREASQENDDIRR